MDTFMSALIKMSLRGVIIILVVLFARLLMKKLQIEHKYILGLWAMAFLYFIFPWKLSVSFGFWNNMSIPEEMGMISEFQPVENERYEEDDDTENIVNLTVTDIADHTMVDASVALEKDIVGNADTNPTESTGEDTAGINEIKENNQEKTKTRRMIKLIWLAGFSVLFGHMLYSYFALKRKLRLSILFKDNIWWTENIDIPIVFGPIHSQIYLPIPMLYENHPEGICITGGPLGMLYENNPKKGCTMGNLKDMESEELSYVIAHEKMHVKRKDSLIKMLAYVICLIHWFNLFIWIAYFLFGNDMEKACDEEVIRSMSREEQKKYAYALLHIATGNGSGKKRIFVAPICFNEGNVKSRIWNIMKYRYTIPGIGAVAVIVILVLSAIFMTETKASNVEKNVEIEESREGTAGEDDEENIDFHETTGEKTETMSIIHEKADILYYEDGSPYIHHILTNNTDKRIIETEYCILAYDENGLPLKLHWNFLDSSTESSYENLVRTKTGILPNQTEDYPGGWSLYDGERIENMAEIENDEAIQVTYPLFCLKQVVFEDGTIWNNPDYENWFKDYAGKQIDIGELQNYYPHQYEIENDK